MRPAINYPPLHETDVRSARDGLRPLVRYVAHPEIIVVIGYRTIPGIIVIVCY